MKKIFFTMKKSYLLGSVLTLLFSCTSDTGTDPGTDEQTKYSVTITLNPSEGGQVNPNGGQFNENQQVQFKVNPNEDYEFTGWSGGWSGTENPLTLTIDGNKSLTVNFSLKDSDGDGVTDNIDQCPDTPQGEEVDNNGCSSSQIDTDGDGVMDSMDECPDTPIGQISNENGCSEWENTYGGSNNEVVYSGITTKEGDFIQIGFTKSFGNGERFYLTKTNKRGVLDLEKYDFNFGGVSIEQNSDGGYVISSNILVKLDNNFNLIWEKTIDGVGRSVRQINDGGYILTGENNPIIPGRYDIYLVKTNSNGQIIWENSFGGELTVDYSKDVQQTTDGGFIITGSRRILIDGPVVRDVILIKTDENGSLLWEKTFGGSGTQVGNSVKQTPDGGFIVLGYTDSQGNGSTDIYMIKTDSNGNLQWEKTFGGGDIEIGESIILTNDGGYIVTGSTRTYGEGIQNIYVIKTDNIGNVVWEKTFGGNGFSESRSINHTEDGGYIISGSTDSFGNGLDFYLIKFFED